MAQRRPHENREKRHATQANINERDWACFVYYYRQAYHLEPRRTTETLREFHNFVAIRPGVKTP
jgi:hypothetical protein